MIIFLKILGYLAYLSVSAYIGWSVAVIGTSEKWSKAKDMAVILGVLALLNLMLVIRGSV